MSALKKLIAGVAVAGVLVPSLAFAQTSTTSASVQATLAQIQALETQIKALQAQHEALLAQYKLLAQQQNTALISLIQTLKEGSTGDQVAVLQALLALDPSIYPEGSVSGYFGKLTAKAVKRFQKKHGLEQVGLVGPKTLKKLNELLRELEDEDDDDDDDDDDDGDRGRGRPKITFCHNGQTITVGRSAAVAHLRHGDSRGACGGTGTTTPPTADITAPVISAVVATGITPSAAVIGWTTNEGASSQVEYGLTSSYTASTTLNAALLTAHSVALSGLTASTLYHFRVLSKDAAGNLGVSGDMTFSTLATPDTTAPIISSLLISALASTSASVSWTTNENATGKVYYSTTSPAYPGGLTMLENSLTTAHAFNLSGLTASTTYYYAVESKDAANNTATSSAGSFITL